MLFRKIQAQQSNYKSNKLYKIHKTRQKTNGIAVRLIKCKYKEYSHILSHHWCKEHDIDPNISKIWKTAGNGLERIYKHVIITQNVKNIKISLVLEKTLPLLYRKLILNRVFIPSNFQRSPVTIFTLNISIKRLLLKRYHGCSNLFKGFL